jgi:hypothetical protein
MKNGGDVYKQIVKELFLQRFLTNGDFDYMKMNKYMGNIPPFPRTSNDVFSSADINVLLEEAEKRGDL